MLKVCLLGVTLPVTLDLLDNINMVEPNAICEQWIREGHSIITNFALNEYSKTLPICDAVLIPNQLSISWQEQSFGYIKPETERAIEAISLLPLHVPVFYLLNDPRPRFAELMLELQRLTNRKLIAISAGQADRVRDSAGMSFSDVLTEYDYQLLSGQAFPHSFTTRQDTVQSEHDLLMQGTQLSLARITEIKHWTSKLTNAVSWGPLDDALPSITNNKLNANGQELASAISKSAGSLVLHTDWHIACNTPFTSRFWQALTYGSHLFMPEANWQSFAQANASGFTDKRATLFAVVSPEQLANKISMYKQCPGYRALVQEQQRSWYLELIALLHTGDARLPSLNDMLATGACIHD